MPLIDGSRLLRRLRKNLKKATHVDIAVAWAKPCDEVVQVLPDRGYATWQRG